jgi:molecular chaperone DnaK
VEIVGIDFGTTNTVAAAGGLVLPLALEQGSAVLPSVVAFPPNGATLIGSAARRRRAIDPKNTIASIKRLLGRGWNAAEVTEYRVRSPLDLIRRDDGSPAIRTRAGVHDGTDIAALILEGIVREMPAPPAQVKAVITVPSRFQDEHRRAVVGAARKAGLGRVAIVDEPVATALAYLTGSHHSYQRVAVYDLGGGTLDVAVVDCRQRPIRVIAHGGDLYLGGDDIDRALAEWAAEQVAERQRWDLRTDPVVFDRLVVECERAKIRVGQNQMSLIDLGQVDPSAPLAERYLEIDTPTMEQLCMALIYRSFVVCDAVLADAGTDPSQIDAVFMAGGTTLLPMVHQAVEKYFGKPPRTDIDPVEVVSIGASLAAGAREW